jgi:hypothetical protein
MFPYITRYPSSPRLPHVGNRTLQQLSSIQLMEELNVRRHGRTGCLAQAFVEDALQPELYDTLVALHNGRHLEQAIRVPDVLDAGRVAAPHHDRLWGFGDYLEVIGDYRPHGVRRVLELLFRPELVLGVFILILPREIEPLDVICYIKVISAAAFTTRLKSGRRGVTHHRRPRHRRRRPRPACPPSPEGWDL